MSLPRLICIAVLSAVVVLAGRQAGGLEALELAAYDQGVRWRAGGANPSMNVAVIAIDDTDLTSWGWPVPDRIMDSLIGKLLSMGAAVVCMDIYRDRPVPPGNAALASRLRDEARVVGALKYTDAGDAGVAAPPSITDPTRRGFTDVAPDPDGTIRRGLLYLGGDNGVEAALALQCAKLVLATEGVRPQQAAGALSVALGEAVLMPLPAGFGGYTRVDARGHQFLLDFRARPGDVPVIHGRDVLDGTADASLLSGRIALIGTTSQVVKDAFALPVAGGAGQGRTYGVVLHALAADQILRLARGANRTMRALSPLWEGIAVLAGAVLMALAMWRRRSGMSVAAAICAVSACLAVGYLGLLGDWWLPAVPAVIAIVMTAVLALGFVRQSRPGR